jgi:hypothetical protein
MSQHLITTCNSARRLRHDWQHFQFACWSWAAPVLIGTLGALYSACQGPRATPDLAAPRLPVVVVETTPEESLSAAEAAIPAQAAAAKLALGDFTSESTCSGCHPHQAEQWQHSAHAHSMTDPVFQALLSRAAHDPEPTRDFCVSCHSNIGTAIGELPERATFERMDPIVLEGVTCESCHRVTDVFRSANAGHTLSPKEPMQGTVHAGNESPYHDTVRSDVLGTPELCASCHDVQSPAGVALEQPYREWSDSKARSEGLVCIDCHMPRSLGRAAEGFDLPERPVRRHGFLGLGALSAALADGSNEAEAIRSDLQKLLEQSVSLSIDRDVFAARGQARLYVRVQSHVEGHRFPTGSNFFRQLWLRVRIRDASGRLLYDSRQAPAASTTTGSPFLLSARLLDQNGAVTQLPWRAAQLENRALGLGETRLITVPFALAPTAMGPLSIEAWLELRSFPEELLDELDLPRALANPFELGRTAAQCPVVSE